MKNILFAGIIMVMLAFVSCGTTGISPQQPDQSPAAAPATTSGNVLGSLLAGTGDDNLLGSLLSGLLSNATALSAESIQGTWVYSGPECRFESENWLAQAGGTVVASNIEAKMAEAFSKIGIGTGTCSLTFSSNNSCIVVVSGKSIPGTYTLNPQTRQLQVKSITGLLSITGMAYISGKTLTILFDSQKLLNLVQSAGALAGDVGGVGTISSLLNSYDGMQLGFNLTR